MNNIKNNNQNNNDPMGKNRQAENKVNLMNRLKSKMLSEQLNKNIGTIYLLFNTKQKFM